MKYVKKPIVIEAVLTSVIVSYETGADETIPSIPDWAIAALDADTIKVDDAGVTIETLEGTMIAGADDWIIQGVKGELYPCKPDIFEATYDVFDDAGEECPPVPIGKYDILKFFEYEHLPEHLQAVSKPFHAAAYVLASSIQPSAEVSAGLRKLLEAKDCFVRGAIQ